MLAADDVGRELRACVVHCRGYLLALLLGAEDRAQVWLCATILSVDYAANSDSKDLVSQALRANNILDSFGLRLQQACGSAPSSPHSQPIWTRASPRTSCA